jgi:hypothetical protein
MSPSLIFPSCSCFEGGWVERRRGGIRRGEKRGKEIPAHGFPRRQHDELIRKEESTF